MTRDRIPQVARSVVWKLMLAPVIALVTSGWVVVHHGAPPMSLLFWFVPMACAAALFFSNRAVFGFLGAIATLAILGWQATAALEADSWVVITDIGFLAIAPAAALLGCVALVRAWRRVEFALI